ncbi:hypothetical protein [Candidatus Mycoplasma haematominutum]|uniref:hypothetical protein n=1 Tax=Candidatus Mycoplasma haematominutum TaxID=209446 RepID=UPI00031DA2AB|nr:hypothetical protein [Candidatus Mycoplasma haematominutum]
MNEADQGNTIKTIYTENTKEGNTLNLEQESQVEVLKITEQSKKWIEDYQSAKSKLESFVSSAAGSARRSKRSTSSSVVASLTQKEREAIWEMYKLFEEIERERKKLIPKFNEIDNSLTITEATKDRPTQSTLQSALAKIQWTTQSKVKWENPAPRAKLGRSASTPTHLSWELWTNNPFKSFMEETDYKQLKRKIKDLEAQHHQQKRNGMVRRGIYQTAYNPTAQDRLIAQRLETAREEVTSRVALQLLNWMGQNKSYR